MIEHAVRFVDWVVSFTLMAMLPPVVSMGLSVLGADTWGPVFVGDFDVAAPGFNVETQSRE